MLRRRRVADEAGMARKKTPKKRARKKAVAKANTSPPSGAKKTTQARRGGRQAAGKTSPAPTKLTPVAELVPIAKIDPAPYNPSRPIKPGDAGFERLRKAIEQFGAVQLLVWNKRTGHLVGGHQTLSVMRAIDPQLKSVACSVVDLPEDLEKALNLRLNRRATDDDPVRLGELLQQVLDADVDEQLTGLDEGSINASIAAMQAELDAAPPADLEGDDEGERSKDEGEDPKIASSYQVVAECNDEDHQRQLYEQLRKQGVAVRLLTLY